MLVSRIDHVAVAVSDLDAAIAFYRAAWELEVSHRVTVEDQGVEEAMLAIGDSNVQLLAPLSPDSTVARFLERRGEGLHHIAYEVPDLQAALDDLRNRGVPLIDETPRKGGRDDLIAFVHPRANNGLLVELIQKPRE